MPRSKEERKWCGVVTDYHRPSNHENARQDPGLGSGTEMGLLMDKMC